MSGGSMNYFHERLQDVAHRLTDSDEALFEATDEARAKFKAHLQWLAQHMDRAAAALKAIEWNDSGDGANNETALIEACIAAREALAATDDAPPTDAPEFQQGDVVRYVPLHAHGNASHPDSETGTVSSARGPYVFVRFGEGDQSAACNPSQLLLVRRP